VLTTTEGIVLKTQKYSEADMIITCLTLDNGIVKAFAKSPRKIKSRFGSSLEPLTHSNLSFLGKEHSMPRIVKSDIIKSFHGLREDIIDFINMSKLAEILIALMPERIPNKKLFLFFLNIMDLIGASEQKQKGILHLISQIHLLMILGYVPRLSGCGKCGQEGFNFYPKAGTIFCEACAATQPENIVSFIKLTSRVIKFYLHCLKWPLHALIRLRPSPETISTLSSVIEEHLKHLLNKKLKSSEFLAKINLPCGRDRRESNVMSEQRRDRTVEQ